ncbi:12842_t:CDS:2, partial [Racocetra persica]
AEICDYIVRLSAAQNPHLDINRFLSWITEDFDALLVVWKYFTPGYFERDYKDIETPLQFDSALVKLLYWQAGLICLIKGVIFMMKFHDKCDDEGRAMVMMKIHGIGEIMSGYSPIMWIAGDGYRNTE